MAKKHGFRGTPVRPSGSPSSMGRIFEQRGDKMVTAREGIKDFGRNPESENPDLDRYFAGIARDLLKPQQVDKTNALAKLAAKDSYDPQRRAAQIMLETRNKVRKAEEGAQVARVSKGTRDDGVLPDNIPRTVAPNSKAPSREKQTPVEMPKKPGFYDFSGHNPPKEIIKNGKVYRRK